MNQKFVTFTVALVLLVVAIAVDGKEEKMKGRKPKHGSFKPCMKPELLSASDSPIKTMISNNVISCMQQMSISRNMSSEGEQKVKNMKHGKHGEWKKVNPCFGSCVLKGLKVLSADNTTMNSSLIEKMVADYMKPEVQTKFMDNMKACFVKKNISLDKVVMKENCEGMKEYITCAMHATKDCQDGNAEDSKDSTEAPSNKDVEDSDEDENDS